MSKARMSACYNNWDSNKGESILMSKRFIAILLVFIAIFIGLFVVNKKDATAPDSETVTASNHSQGENQNGVVLLEYGDFQCPACGAYYPVLRDIKAKYNDQISFQFRHFPIVGSHPNAMAAHRAAEAAAKQDKFWEMHDLLYENQRAWSSSNNPASIFEDYAQQLSLDLEKYRQDLASAEVKDIIDADVEAGRNAGVAGTPTFFLNGQKIEPSLQTAMDDFSKAIDEAIKTKSQE